MTKEELSNAANIIDRVVANLCDALDFEEGDRTDLELTALADVAMRLRMLAND